MRALDGKGVRGEARGVEKADDDPGAAEARQRTLDPHPLEPVVGGAEARGVEKPEHHAIDVGPLLDHVTRRAGDLRHQRPLLAQQAVQERALAHVRRADQRYGDPLLDGVSQRERLPQRVDPAADFLHRVAQEGAVGEFDLLFRKIEFQFEQRGQVEQPFAQCLERLGVAAPHLVRGQRMRRARRGGDQIADGFGLREVQLARQVGAQGELARLGHAGAGGDQETQDFGDDERRAVRRDFDRVLARVGAGGAEDGDQHVVDRLFALDDAAVMDRVARGFGQGRRAAEDAVGDGEGFAAAKADDGQGAARRGGGGGDGIAVADHRPSMRRRCPMRSLWALLSLFQRMSWAVVTR